MFSILKDPQETILSPYWRDQCMMKLKHFFLDGLGILPLIVCSNQWNTNVFIIKYNHNHAGFGCSNQGLKCVFRFKLGPVPYRMEPEQQRRKGKKKRRRERRRWSAEQAAKVERGVSKWGGDQSEEWAVEVDFLLTPHSSFPFFFSSSFCSAPLCSDTASRICSG